MCPSTPKKLRLLVVSGYDELKNKICLCCFILIMDEKEETFLEIFKVLREEPYHMNPLFALGQIKAVKKYFQMHYIMDVFFIGVFGKKFKIMD